MNAPEIIQGLPRYFIQNVPSPTISLIANKFGRIEDFFLVNICTYLETLFQNGEVENYKFQHHINYSQNKRRHIDIYIKDSENINTYLEVKHFAIDKGRNFLFYTSNSAEGAKVGIIKDFMKFNSLIENNCIPPNSRLYCLAFVTQKLTLADFEAMKKRFKSFPEAIGWNIWEPAFEITNLLNLLVFEKDMY